MLMPMLAACGSVDTGNVGLYNRYGQIDKVTVGKPKDKQ